MENFIKQIRSLGIPYPQKRLLELELRQDMEFRSAAEGDDLFCDHDLESLVEIHSTELHRVLNRFEKEQRKLIENVLAVFPVLTAFVFIIKEDNMVNFIQEGGAGMYAILIIGLFLLGKEALNMVRLLFIKDHSEENLRIDTASVGLGCLALMFIGIGWTCLGVYISATAPTQVQAPYDLLLVGIKESLTPTILSSLLCALIILTHYATRRLLFSWRAPIL